MTSITESFRRRIADAERVLPLVGDTPPQVRIRLDFLKEMLDEIDAEHERRVTELLEENAELRKELESVGMAAYLYGREKAHEGEGQD